MCVQHVSEGHSPVPSKKQYSSVNKHSQWIKITNKHPNYLPRRRTPLFLSKNLLDYELDPSSSSSLEETAFSTSSIIDIDFTEDVISTDARATRKRVIYHNYRKAYNTLISDNVLILFTLLNIRKEQPSENSGRRYMLLFLTAFKKTFWRWDLTLIVERGKESST